LKPFGLKTAKEPSPYEGKEKKEMEMEEESASFIEKGGRFGVEKVDDETKSEYQQNLRERRNSGREVGNRRRYRGRDGLGELRQKRIAEPFRLLRNRRQQRQLLR